MLEGKDISFSYKKGKAVLKNISLSVSPNERVGIVAPSGYGKSTLAKIMAGVLRSETGKVVVDGDEDAFGDGYSPVQLICQNPELAVNPRLRMMETLNEGYDVDFRTRKAFGIRDEWMERFPCELSGGELQRFCIVLALGPETRYLITDEITTMLDANTQALIWKLLLEQAESRKLGMLVITHNMHLARRVCTRIIELDKMGR